MKTYRTIVLVGCLMSYGGASAGVINGLVREAASGQNLAGVRVAARELDKGIERVCVSDAEGRYKFADLDDGRYELTVSTGGFDTSSARVALSGQQMAVVDLYLHASNAGQVSDVVQQLLKRVEALEARLAPAENKQAAVQPQHMIPEALAAPEAAPSVDNFTPFAYGDFTWLNGTPRNKDTVLDTKFFTPEVRFDTHFIEDFNEPRDHSMGGSTEEFRSGEFQIEQISVGGDFHWQNVRGRILTMMGMFGFTTPRNDASAGVGQWDVRGAYRYVSEAYGGYHFDVNHGLNVDAGIFVSYIGLFSYYNFDNWAYQPSYVSSNTPWFFNGLRVQWFPTNKLKIEPWLINGWQSYGRFSGQPGLGLQVMYRPTGSFAILGNQYYGSDTLFPVDRKRVHTDDSIQLKYFDRPGRGLDKAAMSFTVDAGCEFGSTSGVSCRGGNALKPSQYFLGFMSYQRFWFD